MLAVRRHTGRKPGAEPLGRAGAVGGLPEQTGLASRREEEQATSVGRPHRSEVSPGVERQLAERLACEIPHPDVVLLASMATATRVPSGDTRGWK